MKEGKQNKYYRLKNELGQNQLQGAEDNLKDTIFNILREIRVVSVTD